MLWRQICERHSFAQPLTRTVPWEWLFMSKTVRIQHPERFIGTPGLIFRQYEFKTVEKAHGIGRFVYALLYVYTGVCLHLPGTRRVASIRASSATACVTASGTTQRVDFHLTCAASN